MALLIALIVCSVLVAVFIRYITPIVEVCGNSMYPTFHDGSLVFAVRIFNHSSIKVGDVVIAVPPPESDCSFVIKRVHNVSGGRVTIIGDNPDHSFDSRHYGSIPVSSVKFKVIKTLYSKET